MRARDSVTYLLMTIVISKASYLTEKRIEKTIEMTFRVGYGSMNVDKKTLPEDA